MPSDPTIPLPRILCLHGGGTSADIFTLQCRTLISHLSPKFRLVFPNAPFSSPPHPAIVPYFGDHGPFYRWLRWSESDPVDADAAATLISHIESFMRDDEGTGPYVGVLGFSQGAKIAASLLWRQENIAPGPFKFGVIIAGRAPVVLLDPEGTVGEVKHTADVGQISTEFRDWAPDCHGEHAISTPTLHVHGLQDPGMDLHRLLAEDYCHTGTARIVDWDGGHRLPVRAEDVKRVVDGLLDVAKEGGVL